MTEILTPQELVEQSVSLVSLPDVVFQINEMIRDSRYSAMDIGDVISKDPALTARLLKIVNSSFYGFQARIDTLGRAITIVGMDDLHNLVLATTAVDRFDRIPQDLVDMTEFWMRSINCGIIGRSVGKKIAVLNSERLFTAGLLHNVGSLLMYSKMPDSSREVLLAADGNHRILPGLEQEIFGFTYADVGAELAMLWNLPESLTAAIGHHLFPENAGDHQLDATLIHLGDLLSNIHVNGSSIEETMAEVSNETLSFLNLEEQQIVEIVDQTPEEFAQIVNLILPKHDASY